ncbi:MAG: hypothetical protein ACREBH_01325 [Candidatus Micrarchaeaceae archaeon]
MRRITKEIVTSSITIILAILAIALFISSGGTLIFYAVLSIAIILGIYNAWLISVAESNSAETSRHRPASRKPKSGRRKK